MELLLVVILLVLIYLVYKVHSISALIKSDIDPQYFKNIVTTEEYERAKQFVLNRQKPISTTRIQSEFGWGYAKCRRIMDQLEEDGVVSNSL